MKIFKDFGFWNESAINVRGQQVVPKDAFNAVFGPELAKFVDTDQCAVRGVGVGTRNGRKVRIQIDIFDRQCPDTGFTSMERLTGYSTSIYAQEVVQGRVQKGAIRYEEAMTGRTFLAELKKRGIQIRIQETVENSLD
jgi:lysine 6-dehydrogenase